MKGANWIPADSFVTRMTPERYRFLLQSAADANMNMLRVWGGGIYEDDRFYDLCDELGLLVWQDFMFACSMYPGDEAFLENVRQEAIDNVRRLRNHPSLALWAGNNEIEAAWQQWGWQVEVRAQQEGAGPHLGATTSGCSTTSCPACRRRRSGALLHAQLAQRRTTRRSRPTSAAAATCTTGACGTPRTPYEAYADNISRFMSEYGFQSFPELASVARYTTPRTDWNIESPGDAVAPAPPARQPADPHVHGPRLPQAQGLRVVPLRRAGAAGGSSSSTRAEAHRRAMGHNWGSLYWQLDDCWPVASWSGIDYYGRWKALHYFARRFFAPVLASPVIEKGVVSVWGSRIGAPTRRRGSCARLVDFSGRELARREQAIVLAANAADAYLTFPEAEILKGADPARVVLVTELAIDGAPAGARPERNLLYFKKTKDLQLPRPEVKLAVADAGGGAFTVSVTAKQLARNVFLTSGAVDGMFADNYFDVLAGETIAVMFRPRATTTAGQLQAAISATSIADTF